MRSQVQVLDMAAAIDVCVLHNYKRVLDTIFPDATIILRRPDLVRGGSTNLVLEKQA
jgi:hypothetical protein